MSYKEGLLKVFWFLIVLNASCWAPPKKGVKSKVAAAKAKLPVRFEEIAAEIFPCKMDPQDLKSFNLPGQVRLDFVSALYNSLSDTDKRKLEFVCTEAFGMMLVFLKSIFVLQPEDMKRSMLLPPNVLDRFSIDDKMTGEKILDVKAVEVFQAKNLKLFGLFLKTISGFLNTESQKFDGLVMPFDFIKSSHNPNLIVAKLNTPHYVYSMLQIKSVDFVPASLEPVFNQDGTFANFMTLSDVVLTKSGLAVYANFKLPCLEEKLLRLALTFYIEDNSQGDPQIRFKITSKSTVFQVPESSEIEYSSPWDWFVEKSFLGGFYDYPGFMTTPKKLTAALEKVKAFEYEIVLSEETYSQNWCKNALKSIYPFLAANILASFGSKLEVRNYLNSFAFQRYWQDGQAPGIVPATKDLGTHYDVFRKASAMVSDLPKINVPRVRIDDEDCEALDDVPKPRDQQMSPLEQLMLDEQTAWNELMHGFYKDLAKQESGYLKKVVEQVFEDCLHLKTIQHFSTFLKTLDREISGDEKFIRGIICDIAEQDTFWKKKATSLNSKIFELFGKEALDNVQGTLQKMLGLINSIGELSCSCEGISRAISQLSEHGIFQQCVMAKMKDGVSSFKEVWFNFRLELNKDVDLLKVKNVVDALVCMQMILFTRLGLRAEDIAILDDIIRPLSVKIKEWLDQKSGILTQLAQARRRR